jgi:hypothetical protein
LILAADYARPRLWLWKKGPDAADRRRLDSNPAPAYLPETQPPSASCSTRPSPRTPIRKFNFRSCTVQPVLPRPDSKRMPRKIRYARPVACQGAPTPKMSRTPVHPRHFPAPRPPLTKLLRVVYFILTDPDFCWSSDVFRSGCMSGTRPSRRNAGTGVNSMLEISTDALLLIPACLAVTFMLWVLWNLLKEERRIASLIAARRKKSVARSQRSGLRSLPSQQPAIPRA